LMDGRDCSAAMERPSGSSEHRRRLANFTVASDEESACVSSSEPHMWLSPRPPKPEGTRRWSSSPRPRTLSSHNRRDRRRKPPVGHPPCLAPHIAPHQRRPNSIDALLSLQRPESPYSTLLRQLSEDRPQKLEKTGKQNQSQTMKKGNQFETPDCGEEKLTEAMHLPALKSSRPPSSCSRTPIRAPTPEKEPQLVARILDQLLPVAPAHADATSPGGSRGFNRSFGRLSTGGKAGARLAQICRAADGDENWLPSTPSHSSDLNLPPRPPSVGMQKSSTAELVVFRTSLSKSFGNLTRAFSAMKHAVDVSAGKKVGSSTGASSLSRSEFEWCITTYLRYGDKRLARRLFAALDTDNKGEVGLVDLAQPAPRAKGLVSLVEFRRRLLDRHSSLPQAFR